MKTNINSVVSNLKVLHIVQWEVNQVFIQYWIISVYENIWRSNFMTFEDLFCRLKTHAKCYNEPFENPVQLQSKSMWSFSHIDLWHIYIKGEYIL